MDGGDGGDGGARNERILVFIFYVVLDAVSLHVIGQYLSLLGQYMSLFKNIINYLLLTYERTIFAS